MRVLVVTTSFGGGGAEFVARTWAGTLAGMGHDVTMATTTRHDDGTPPAGVSHVALDASSTLRTARSLRRAAAHVDVVLAVQSLPNLLALVSVPRRVAVVVSERNITSRERAHESTRPADRVKRAIARRLYRRADLAIAVSHSVAAELVSAYRVPIDRVVTVPNPALHRAEQQIADGWSRDQAPHGADGVLHLALPMRLVPQKRIGLAVDAAAVLRARGHDVRLLSFGTPAGTQALRDLADAADVPLEAPGWVADWTRGVPTGSVAVLPSYREGFGNVLVEAAAAGIPSVAVSNAFGVSDALVPQLSGVLSPVGTAEAVADAILEARALDLDGVAAWTRRFGTAESGRLLVRALERARDHHASRRSSHAVMVSAVGQYDNVGDTVLRRGFLDHLRALGPLHVFVGDRSADYLTGLGLRSDDTAISSRSEWRRGVRRHVLAGGVYAFDTGEIEVGRRFAKRYLTLAPLLLVGRLRGGTAVQLGVGVRRGTPWRVPIAAALRICRLVSWRDPLSRQLMGFGDVTPDWAFALGAPAEVLLDGDAERPMLAVAVRQSLDHDARDRPDDRWVEVVRGLAHDLGLDVVVVAQITRDGPLALELADRLGGEALTWASDDHDAHERRLREVYRRTSIVLSDRLHALVMAVTEGAVPIALSSGAADKVTRTLVGAGITDTSVDRSLRDPGVTAERVRAALGRRADIMAAVVSARERLDVLGERLHDVVVGSRRP